MNVGQQRDDRSDPERPAQKVHQGLFGHITFVAPGNYQGARRRPLASDP